MSEPLNEPVTEQVSEPLNEHVGEPITEQMVEPLNKQVIEQVIEQVDKLLNEHNTIKNIVNKDFNKIYDNSQIMHNFTHNHVDQIISVAIENCSKIRTNNKINESVDVIPPICDIDIDFILSNKQKSDIEKLPEFGFIIPTLIFGVIVFLSMCNKCD